MKTQRGSKRIKQAAAIAGAVCWLRMEEEGTCRPKEGDEAPAPSSQPSAWGLSGRQSQMQLRSLMQLKGFHGSRTR